MHTNTFIAHYRIKISMNKNPIRKKNNNKKKNTLYSYIYLKPNKYVVSQSLFITQCVTK